MKVLLSMAFLFFILKNDIFAKGKPARISNNYTYRLMELEATGDSPEHTKYRYPPGHKYATKLINPRAPRYRPTASDDDTDGDAKTVDQKRLKKYRPTRIPADLEDEISHLQIPMQQRRLPKRTIRKRKVKKSIKSPKKKPAKSRKSKARPVDDDYGVVVDDINIDDSDDEHHQEEEEETEEKKEKMHKVTIKKKRPFKNSTDEGAKEEGEKAVKPYRTIIETAQSGAMYAPHRLQYPFGRITRHRGVRPLALLENVDVLNPVKQPADNSGANGKDVKPRDVSLILRTKNRNPRILIRRYRPYVNALAYPFLGQYPAVVQPNARKKHRRRRRKQRKRRKKHGRPADSASYSNAYATDHHPVPCSNEHHSHAQLPFGAYAPLAGHHASIYPGSLHADDYLDRPSLQFPSLDVAEPTNDYASAPYDRYAYASEPPLFATDVVPLGSTKPPPSYAQTGESVSDEEPMTASYDVREHENTAELAATHKQETDDSLEEDNEALQYDDAELDDGRTDGGGDNADVEYENEAEESLRFVSMYGRTTKGGSKPIKKVDSERAS